MGTEIERKYLVDGEAWRPLTTGQRLLRQGYLHQSQGKQIRVRVAEDKAYFAIKGARVGITRKEFEYEIPREDGEALLGEFAEKPLIEKTRFEIVHGGHDWVIDEYHGANLGLIVAEIELDDEDAEFPLPSWAGDDISGDDRYANVQLVRKPFSEWAF